MGSHTSKAAARSEPVYSWSPQELSQLRSLFAYLRGSSSSSSPGGAGGDNAIATLDQKRFIEHLELPAPLALFGRRLFRAFTKASEPEELHHHHQATVVLSSPAVMTLHQFLIGAEKCCKAGVSQQLRFLFEMYEDQSGDYSNNPPHVDAAASAQVVVEEEETERKDQIKSLLFDCTLLAKFLYGAYNATDHHHHHHDHHRGHQEAPAHDDEEKQEEEEEEDRDHSLSSTLGVTGDDLHLWDKLAIDPMLAGLLLFNERENGSASGPISLNTFIAWASDTVTNLFKSTVEVPLLFLLSLLPNNWVTCRLCLLSLSFRCSSDGGFSSSNCLASRGLEVPLAVVGLWTRQKDLRKCLASVCHRSTICWTGSSSSSTKPACGSSPLHSLHMIGQYRGASSIQVRPGCCQPLPPSLLGEHH